MENRRGAMKKVVRRRQPRRGQPGKGQVCPRKLNTYFPRFWDGIFEEPGSSMEQWYLEPEQELTCEHTRPP